jgi:phage shock protein A
MAIMLAKTYQALKAAGAPEGDAIAAAEELAAYENRLASIENRLDRVENRLDGIENRLATVETRVAELAGKITVLTWAVGINAAATIAILGVLLRGHAPVP